MKKSIRRFSVSLVQRLAMIAAASCLLFAPGRAHAQRPIGVDVSHYQGFFNWTNVHSSGVSFAWAKATEGTTYVDAYFTTNESRAKAVGIYMGAYHFAHPESDTPASEVTHFWNVAKTYILADGKTLMPMLDMEVFTGVTGATSYSDWANQWCNAALADAAGQGVRIRPAIYVSACNAGNFNSSVSQWISDIANYNGENAQTGTPWSSCSADDVWGSGVWSVWQYTDAAIQGDGDVFNGTTSTFLSAMVAVATHPPADSYAGNEDNGIIETFLPDAVNVLEIDSQTSANGTWTGWSSFGGTAYGTPPAAPTAGYNANGEMQLFLRGSDNSVMNAAQTSVNGSWSVWQNLAGNVRGSVTVGYLTTGAMELFARSSTNTVETMLQSGPNGTWGSWSNLAGACFADPTVGANADGRMQLFCVSSTNTLQSNFKTTAGAWFGWANYGGNCIGKPAIVNLEDGSIEVFVRTSSNTVATLTQTSPNGSWGSWSDLGGSCVADPVAGYNADGRPEIFVQTSAHAVSANYRLTTSPTSAWSGWTNMGGSCYSALTVSYNADGRMQLFMRDANYVAWSDWQTAINGGWFGWSNWAGNTPTVSITTQPASEMINVGQNAAFSVVATGVLGYQWRFNSGNISGATNSNYTITGAQTNNAGNYTVVVTNNGSSATSSTAVLSFNVPPSITTQPSSETVNQGQPASFSVVAAGTAPLSYQWKMNGANISGATASAYNITSAQVTDAGTYAVVVTNVAGSVTSANATLTVNVPPSITTQPSSETVNQGQPASFSVVASGTAPLSYQWTLNGANISGATASAYSITSAQATDAGTYAVVVTNVAGSVTSADATLTVILPPIINVQPASQLAAVSNSVTFSVGLSQGTSPSYQWKYNGANISGATLSSVTVSALTWGSAGNYSVVVTNAAGSATSANAVLKMEQAVFTNTNGFETYNLGILDRNQTNSANTNLSNPWWGPGNPNLQVFGTVGSVTPHTGTKMISAVTNTSFDQEYLNLIYRFNAKSNYYGNIMLDWWFYDTKGTGSGASNYNDYVALAENAPVSQTNDFTTTSFTQYNQRMSLGANTTTGYNVGVYQARIVGATGGFNSNGWFNTATARSVGWHHARMVLGIPTNNSAPVSMFIDNMTNATLIHTNSGVAFGFNLIELNSSFAGKNTGGFYDDFTFRAANDPWVAQQPTNATVTAGQNGGFSTVAVGTGYQWQFNGTNLSGGTKSSFIITNAQSVNAGTYTCVITGTNGTVATSPATLTVH